MSATAAVAPNERPRRRSRGTGLLLAHCAGVGGGEERESPYARLEIAVGGDLARLLVLELSDAQGRRGSSSP